MTRWLVGLLLVIFFMRPVYAVQPEQVRVVGLFNNAAVIKIAGKQRLLKVGQVSPEGVELLSADTRMATLLIDGSEYRLGLSRDHSGGYQEREIVSEQISINARGQYITTGSINGRSVTFLVDTGATSVAMNSVVARS